MIALSSLRPFGSSPEYDRNQMAAWRSWQSAFSLIVYLNDFQPQVDNGKTIFIPSEPYPQIYKMAEIMANQREPCCIINADIIMGDRWNQVYAQLTQRKMLAAVSNRYEFFPDLGLHPAHVVDCGVDFFAATPQIWSIVAGMADERLRLGVGWFDTWLMGCFSSFAMRGFWDITPSKVIFHPKHGDRKYGPGFNHLDIPMVGSAGMPSATIRI